LTEQRTSSSASTGGAGNIFEQHVAAYWLAQLLVGGIPPILIETTVKEVCFQTEHLGWNTDDFLVACERPGRTDQKLIGQVKKNFTISSVNDECRKAIADFWKDFKSTDHFSAADDRLVLVTQRGANTLLENFVGLLDCARAARDGAEFEHRLTTKGFISKKSVEYCADLCKIIADLEGDTVKAADLWSFLRLLYVLSLDLHTSTRQTEAQIKNLLAHTVTEGNALDIASTTWNSLLVCASYAIPQACSLCRADLPDDLLQRHGSLDMHERRILNALKGHTAPVLSRIRPTIGQGFHLQRAALVQKVLDELETAKVVIVSGPAGSGKSVIGKDTVTILLKDHFVFGFRVEEFAQAHIDATLQAGQIPGNAQALSAILAAQGRKVILIESVERLLEKTTRDAFSDLMCMVAQDSSMYLILTCRDYSTDLVRASFLQPAGINHTIVGVPPLEDSELSEIEEALPVLVRPLKNPALREVLRNPYFIDKALEISWSEERPVPESEREFRDLFWRQIVRAEMSALPGMARRREEVFQEIAVRRARALSAYVMCNDLDPTVLDAQRQDSLIVSSEENPSLVAPAHDVLEDWAILKWLDEQHLTYKESFKDLSAVIGTHPAIRRSYRKWIAELIERNHDDADRLFRAAIFETEISSQFRDDTIVSLLMAPSVSAFLIRHESQLWGNDKAILKRMIQVLRVACLKTPVWLAGAAGHGSVFNVPDGPAWAIILKIVYSRIDSFAPQDRPLLLGLIEDAARSVSSKEPEIDGAEAVAGIAHSILAGFGYHSLDYFRSEELRKRALKVIAKIPKADAVRFEAILRGTVKERQQRDRVAEDFREILFSTIDGMQAARDLPDLFISVAIDYLLISESDLPEERSLSSLGLGHYFGVKESLRHDFFPASAFRGPWIFLLQYHPRKALDFYIRIFNHSAYWYAHPRVHDPLEPAWEIELTFADGTTKKQWGNPRLWNLYRGTSVGPYVLQSLLMALEKWLLEYARKYPTQLDDLLVDILRRSESAVLAGVVASVATAYPHASGEALLILLSAPEYIMFDRHRMAGESQASALTGMFPNLRVDYKIHISERQDANNLPHRGQDLEAAILNLQTGPFFLRVHAILDQHLAKLPPNTEQDESDLIWRLAIHRMDLRQYTVIDTNIQENLDKGGGTSESTKPYIKFEPKPPDPDVQAMVDKSAAQSSSMNARLSILVWGLQAFKHENGNHNPSLWKEKLVEAQTMDRETEQAGGSRHGPGIVAAVCVRDHWEEMSVDERDWCIAVVCSEIFRESDQWEHVERMQRFPMAADRSCASTVPLLLHKPLTEEQSICVRQALATALTHPIEEVRWYATWGIDDQFWAVDRATALRCVNAIATEATLVDHEWVIKKRQIYEQQLSFEEIIKKAATTVRQQFWQEEAIDEDAFSKLDISEGYGAQAIGRMLAILSQVPEDPMAVDAFARVSRTLVGWWDTDDNGTHRRERNFEAEAALSELLQRFVMQTTSASALKALRPVLDAIEQHPREIHYIVLGLTGIEASRPNTAHYWYLWGLFADGIRKANWVEGLDDEHPFGSEILSAIFLISGWKENVRHWKSLEGYANHIDTLFRDLPPSSIVLDSYVCFLYQIGEQSLPEAFVHIANFLKRGNPQAMLAKTDTVFF